MPRPIAERFVADTANHQVTIEHDDGLYRHLRCQAPGTWMYGFGIVTWPGYLTIYGDMGDYTFARTEDMFKFFGDRGPLEEKINPHYWAQKLQGTEARRTGAEVFSVEAFRDRVVQWAKGHLEWCEIEAEGAGSIRDEHYLMYPGLLHEALEREVLTAVPMNETEAHEVLRDFEWLFGPDTWEWCIRDYDELFLWCLHGIVWAIEQYREQTSGVACA